MVRLTEPHTDLYYLTDWVNLGILEYFRVINLGILEYFRVINLGIQELLSIFAFKIQIYYVRNNACVLYLFLVEWEVCENFCRRNN